MAGYRKLGRTSDQRKALLRDLVTDLIINERIETTEMKAKELRKLADKMVTLGKKGLVAKNEGREADALHFRREAAKVVRFEKVEQDKDQNALQKLFDVIAPRYASRNGGYTRIFKVGPRQGDAAPMAIIEFVEE